MDEDKVPEYLTDMKKLVEGGWCQQDEAMSRDGQPVAYADPAAIAYSPDGAYWRVSMIWGQSITEAESMEVLVFETLAQALPTDSNSGRDHRSSGRQRVMAYNNQPDTGQAGLLRILDQAVEERRSPKRVPLLDPHQ